MLTEVDAKEKLEIINTVDMLLNTFPAMYALIELRHSDKLFHE